eukprot:UN02363
MALQRLGGLTRTQYALQQSPVKYVEFGGPQSKSRKNESLRHYKSLSSWLCHRRTSLIWSRSPASNWKCTKKWV